MYKIPDFLRGMFEKNRLGEKAGHGFYRKDKDSRGDRIILSIDYNTSEYKPQERVKIASLEAAKNSSGRASLS